MKNRSLSLLILLTVLWAPSFMFIKIAVIEIPPLTLATLRAGIAAVLLVLLLRLQGGRLIHYRGLWKHFLVVGFFGPGIPFALINWGEMYVSSALASIINGTTPLFTILLANWMVADDRMSPGKIFGSFAGLAGLVFLVLPSLVNGLRSDTMGILAITLAAASYGVSMVYARLKLRGLPMLVAPTAQMTVSAILLLPVSLTVESPWNIPFPSLNAILSLTWLAVLGTVAAYIIYYRILEKASASYLSMVTYLVPVFGVFLGVTVLGEQLGWNVYLGCLLILSGVVGVNGGFAILSKMRTSFYKMKLN